MNDILILGTVDETLEPIALDDTSSTVETLRIIEAVVKHNAAATAAPPHINEFDFPVPLQPSDPPMLASEMQSDLTALFMNISRSLERSHATQELGARITEIGNNENDNDNRKPASRSLDDGLLEEGVKNRKRRYFISLTTNTYRPFKRNNQIVLNGNNRFGRKGLPRCIPCRRTHSRVYRIFV